MDWWTELERRWQPGPPLAELDLPRMIVVGALGAGLLVVLLPSLWRMLRVAVTVVHELGHGLVGILVGRSFTGLVLRSDMSGHAVTVGRPRGPGRVLTTWAGYPAPALVGLGCTWAGVSGWARPALGLIALVLLGALLRVRSWYTALIIALVTGGAGLLWWAGGPQVQGLVLIAVGILLVLGAWRHLAAVVAAPSRGSDPAVLAELTRVPLVLWNLGFAAVLGAASWATAVLLVPVLRG